MIDAALAGVVRYGDLVALQAAGDPPERDGKLLCAEEGGPAVDHASFALTGRSTVSAWESWKLHRGTR